MTKQMALRQQFQKATDRLAEVLQQPKNEFMRDAAIQRFEFCFDLSWKLVKTFLEEIKGVQCQAPKDCWRQAYTTGIIAYDDFWIKLTDARNQTSHTYNETTAEEVHALLPDALKHFQELLKTLH